MRVEVHASEKTVEIFVEADFETHAEERRRFAIMNIPRHLLSEATVRRPDAVQRKIVERCLNLRRRPNDDPRRPDCLAGPRGLELQYPCVRHVFEMGDNSPRLGQLEPPETIRV